MVNSELESWCVGLDNRLLKLEELRDRKAAFDCDIVTRLAKLEARVAGLGDRLDSVPGTLGLRLAKLEAAAPDVEEEAAPCPWCGGVVVMRGTGDFWVDCPDPDCRASGPETPTGQEAIAAWNRVAKRDSHG